MNTGEIIDYFIEVFDCEASEYYFERELSEERDYEIDVLLKEATA